MSWWASAASVVWRTRFSSSVNPAPAFEVVAHDHRVGEVAHHVAQPGLVASRHRDADSDVGLPGVAHQQHVEGRQQGHEEAWRPAAVASARNAAASVGIDAAATGSGPHEAVCDGRGGRSAGSGSADRAGSRANRRAGPAVRRVRSAGAASARSRRSAAAAPPGRRRRHPAHRAGRVRGVMTLMDQPSATMWCTTSTSTWSSGAIREQLGAQQRGARTGRKAGRCWRRCAPGARPRAASAGAELRPAAG